MIWGASPAGLLTGLVAWTLAGGLSVKADALSELETSLSAAHPPAVASRSKRGSSASLLAAPIFALTTGPGAVREPAIRVDGVSVSRRRTAALVSIDGGAAEWLSVGESRGGVTLQGVTADGITVETAIGEKAVKLGDQSAASAPAAAPPPEAVATAAPDRPPPGFRSPPEPASAPRPR